MLRMRVLVVLLVLASPAWGQIAHSTGTAGQSAVNQSSLTYSLTCGSGLIDSVLIVGVSAKEETAADRVVSSVTYNGVNLTKAVHGEHGAGWFRAEIWYLVAPDCDGSAHNVVVTMVGTCSGLRSGATVYTGVDQTTPVEASQGRSGGWNSTATTEGFSTVSDFAWVVDVTSFGNGTGSSATAGSGQTERWQVNSGQGTGAGASSDEGPTSPAGTVVMSWTLPADNNWALAAAALKPAALLADNGELATGDSNTNRPVRVPKHYSTTQPKPASMAVTANGCTRSSNVVTCTLTADPPSPGLAVGGKVAVAGMGKSAFDGTFTITDLPLSNQVRWSQTGADDTTDGGTISSALWPYPSQGGTYTDPQFGSVVERFIDHANCSSGNDCWTEYSNYPVMNKTQEYVVMTVASTGRTIVNVATKSFSCTGVIGSTTGGGRWSPLESDPYKLYFTSTNQLRYITPTNCTPQTVKTFSGYTSISLAPSGAVGRIVENTAGEATAVLIGCASSSCPDNGQMDVLVYNITDDTSGTAYTVQSSSPNIDEVNHFPDGSFIISYGASCTGSCSEQEGGIDYISANGAFHSNISEKTRHTDAGVDSDGANILVGGYNETNPEGPCQSAGATEYGRGWIVWEVATGNTRCVFDRDTASSSGAYANVGDHVSVSGHWFIFAVEDKSNEAVESALSSSWDSNWDRGSGELWACKTKGTIDGTNNCYRLAHLRGRPHNTPGGNVVFKRAYRCSASMLRDSDNAGSIPHFAFCSSDFGTATSGSTAADPLKIVIRAP